MANPTPLPRIALSEITSGDDQRAAQATRDALENVVTHLARIREVIFDESTAKGLASLQGLVKDTLTFPTVGVPTTQRGIGLPLRAPNPGTIQEIHVELGSDAKGAATVVVQVDGSQIATGSVSPGATATLTPSTAALAKDQSVTVLAQGSGGWLVVQVRVT